MLPSLSVVPLLSSDGSVVVVLMVIFVVVLFGYMREGLWYTCARISAVVGRDPNNILKSTNNKF